MGFLSKLMKNPLVQMALPMALTYAAGPLGAKLGASKLFSGMSPLMANALKQSALGFGTSALSGSKRPWKGAMYAGLTSIPFSYMSAANAANTFNKDLADVQGWESNVISPAKTIQGAPFSPHSPKWDASNWRADINQVPNFRQYEIPAKMGLAKTDTVAGLPDKISAWDLMTGRTPNKFTYKTPIPTDKLDPERLIYHGGDSDYYKLIDKTIAPGEVDIFSKTTPLEQAFDPSTGTIGLSGGETKADWLPTAVSQAAALYGGRPTPEEEWEDTQKKRKKELAWMYGVDEDQIEGEMHNPWYSGGMFNTGGIASLNMENGGGVSGPGGPKDDVIDAKLSDGEFVMTAKAVENLGGGDRYEGARKMYSMMNMLDPESESMSEVI